MSKYFGTDGFRGEANKTLTVEHAYKIGRFLGWYYSRNKKDGKCRVVIGKDTRRSSYMFEYSLAAGLTASGADAYLLHVTTTPSVSYVARTEGFDCGVMISASHNPYYDNGIKLINAQGEKMDEDTILKIEAYIDGISGEIPLAVREQIGRTVDHAAGRNRYTGYLISLATRSYKNMRVGLDCANGSAWMIAKSVFDALGASTYVINNEPDGLNINTDCGSTHMDGLIRFVKEKKLDVGFAFDGDGDRCLCVDEKGNLVDGDLILYIYGRYMKERGKLQGNKIVTTVMSNFGLYKALDEAGIEYEKTAVGDKYVYENMASNGYRIILEKKQPLSKLAEPVHIYPQVLENIRVKDKKAAREDKDVQDAIGQVEAALGKDGRILVRESGTEPVMRVMVEAAEPARCREFVDRIIEAIISKGHQEVL